MCQPCSNPRSSPSPNAASLNHRTGKTPSNSGPCLVASGENLEGVDFLKQSGCDACRGANHDSANPADG